MARQELVMKKLFEDNINSVLPSHDAGVKAYDRLRARIRYDDVESVASLNQAYELYQKAADPCSFYNVKVQKPDERFEKIYALMKHIFEVQVLESKERLADSIIRTELGVHKFPCIIIARAFTVPGTQLYDDNGNLTRFSADAVGETEVIVSFVSGNYMPLKRSYTGCAIGAVGHLATLSRFRRNQEHRHGSSVLKAFLETTSIMARERKERLTLVAVEATEDSKGFWYRNGFRWAQDTTYAQPPLAFNTETGDPIFGEVPELLMILPMRGETAISKQLLKESVRTMYVNWCLDKYRRLPRVDVKNMIRHYVMGKVFRQFLSSLNEIEGEHVPLIAPPGV